MRSPTTARGQEVVERAVVAAMDLFHRQGVRGTSLDDVLERAGIGRGQFYRYFDSRDELVPIVLARQVEAWTRHHAAQLGDLSTMAGIERWAATLAELGGGRSLRRWCPMAAMAGEFASDPAQPHRFELGDAFTRMASHLAAGLATMQRDGRLDDAADPEGLAMMFIACFEGGLLVAVTTGERAVLAASLDAAVAAIARHVTDDA